MYRAMIVFAMCASALAQTADRDQLQKLLNGAMHALQFNPAQRGIQPYTMPDFQLILLQPGEFPMNARAVFQTHEIQISPELTQMLMRDPGELLFVIAHEIGHLQDPTCLSLLTGKRLQDAAIKQTCESRADEIGLQYLLAAGYGPFDAAGLMGRMLLLDSRESSVLGIVKGRFLSDHPVDIDRIKHLQEFTQAACQRRPEVCRH